MKLWDQLPLITKRGESDRRRNPFASAKQNVYLFRDKFDDGDVASIPDATVRTSAPGPGQLTFVATGGNEFAIDNNRLEWAGNNLTGGTLDDEYVKATQFFGGGSTLPRVEGQMMLAKILNNNTGSGTFSTVLLGVWNGNPTSTSNADAAIGGWINNLSIIDSGAMLSFEALTRNTEYQMAIALNSASVKGAYYFIRGGAYTDWTLVWIGDGGSTANLTPCCIPVATSSTGAIGYIDDWRMPRRRWLPVPGYSVTGAPTEASNIGIGTADFVMDINVTRAGTGAGSNSLGFIARQNGLTGLLCQIFDDGDVLITDTGTTQTISFSAGVVADGQTWTLRLMTLGSAVRAYVHRAGTTTWTQGTDSPRTWTTNQAVSSIFVASNNTVGIITVNSVKIWRRTWSDGFPNA